ncbi:MAG TPA: FHA domain-containing protein [Lentimicrobium sp.]|nr:FHA domain-containing protein [Lentimicrobium sp.]
MIEELTIGRNPDNYIVIRNDKVSGHHCSIKKVGDDFVIEDLGSSNGTFLNGTRIMRAPLKETDVLLLAAQAIDTRMLLELMESGTCKKGTVYDDFIKQEQLITEFSKLRAVYDKYQKEKHRILRNSNLKSTGLKAGLSFIPVVGGALGILSGTVTGNPQEQMMELEEDFKKAYICPSCFKFLGAEPFENMERRGYCLVCKAKWVR